MSYVLKAALIGLCSSILCACMTTGADAPPLAQRELLNAVLWQQHAPEYGAITTAIYNAATRQLEAAKTHTAAIVMEQRTVAEAKWKQSTPAIIMDIDETVLDNTLYQGFLLRSGEGYGPESWAKWSEAQKATAVPGAVQFTQAARRAGFRIFYVTNRTCDEKAGFDAADIARSCPQKTWTMRNMAAVGLAYADDPDAFLFRSERKDWIGDDKSKRRRHIAERYRIAMLVGDDRRDFISDADWGRAKNEVQSLWGTFWFPLPNPGYGSWEQLVVEAPRSCGDCRANPECCYQERLKAKYRKLEAFTP